MWRNRPRQHFMRIALVTHIKDQAVFRRVIYTVQRNGQFHRAEIGSKMSAGFRYIMDQFFPQTRTQLGKRFAGKRFHICGRMDIIKNIQVRKSLFCEKIKLDIRIT